MFEVLIFNSFAQVVNNLLGTFQCKGGNDDITASPDRFIDDGIEFVCRGLQFLVQTITLRGFHDPCIDPPPWLPVAKYCAPAVAQITGKQQSVMALVLFEFQDDTGRTQDMAGIDKGGANARREPDGLIITGPSTKEFEAVQCIQRSVERLNDFSIISAVTPRPA